MDKFLGIESTELNYEGKAKLSDSVDFTFRGPISLMRFSFDLKED